MKGNIWHNKYGKMLPEQTLKQSDWSYKLIMTDFFLNLFIFVGIEWYHSKQRGRKGVYTKHVWNYFFEEKPKMANFFNRLILRQYIWVTSKKKNIKHTNAVKKLWSDFQPWPQTPAWGEKISI